MSALERVTERETLAKALSVLRSRWLIVAAVVAACMAAAVVRYEKTAKSYVATASVSFQSGTLSDSALNVSSGGSPEPQREADTEVLIAHSPEVAQAVRSHISTHATAAQLLGQVKVETAPNANILEFVASTGQSQYSARLANAFAERFARTVRSDCLDHLLIVNARHLERVLRSYARHYNGHRPLQGLSQEIPAAPPSVLSMMRSPSVDDAPRGGRHLRGVRRHDRLGGLIHEYELTA